MHGILYAVQQKLCSTEHGWVGSSVIHLGDTNVPNAAAKTRIIRRKWIDSAFWWAWSR